MICEYCNMYTTQPLKRTSNLLKKTKEKFMLHNIEQVCHSCYERFHAMQEWSLRKTILYSKKAFPEKYSLRQFPS